ncbi:MAG: HAMP domain-containing sensor histidine kinase [Nitriliruptorales bacterium]|nr:HAMP domain-containing sensor histidine kinase [Nitriliruptorales bacterium]
MSTLSHDLRGPLTTISALAHTLQMHDDRLDRDIRQDLLGRIASKADSLADLVTELLDLTRFEYGVVTPKPETLGLRAFATRVVSKIDGSERVAIRLPDVSVRMDPMMMGRILTNLIANALQHSGPDTHVWVEGGPRNDGIEIRVEDNGDGVPHEQREHLFDAVHASTTDEGHGFGLAAVARFARLQGGDVEVSDRPGGGASFRVWIPHPAEANTDSHADDEVSLRIVPGEIEELGERSR